MFNFIDGFKGTPLPTGRRTWKLKGFTWSAIKQIKFLQITSSKAVYTTHVQKLFTLLHFLTISEI